MSSPVTPPERYIAPDRKAFLEAQKARIEAAIRPVPEPAPPAPKKRRSAVTAAIRKVIQPAPKPVRPRREVDFGLPQDSAARQALLAQVKERGLPEDISALQEFDKRQSARQSMVLRGEEFFNDEHYPAGSSQGGQFAPKGGSGGGDGGEGVAALPKTNPHGADFDEFGRPKPGTDAWLVKKGIPKDTFTRNGSDPNHPYGAQYNAKGQSAPTTPEWQAEHGISKEVYDAHPFTKYDQGTPGRVPQQIRDEYGDDAANLAHMTRVASQSPGVIMPRSVVDEEVAQQWAKETQARDRNAVLPADPTKLVGEARPDDKIVIQGQKLGGLRADVAKAETRVLEANALSSGNVKDFAATKVAEAEAEKSRADGLTHEQVLRDAQNRDTAATSALDLARRGDPARGDYQDKIDAARTEKRAAAKSLTNVVAGQTAMEELPGAKAELDKRVAVRKDASAALKDERGREAQGQLSDVAGRQADYEKALTAENVARANARDIKAAFASYQYRTPEGQQKIADDTLASAKKFQTLANEDPSAAVLRERSSASAQLDKADTRLADLKVQYAFPAGTSMAGRVSIIPDAKNVSNFKTTDGRVYVIMEGEIKEQAMLSSLKAEQAKGRELDSSVISVPSVTLWRPSEYGLLATKYMKGREVVLVPDADGKTNWRVENEARALQARTEIATGHTAHVIVAAPPLDENGEPRKFNFANGAPEKEKGYDDYAGHGGTIGGLEFENRSSKVEPTELARIIDHYNANLPPGQAKISVGYLNNRNHDAGLKDSSVVHKTASVLHAVSTLLGPKGTGKAGTKTIADAAGLDEMTTARHLMKLQHIGVLTIVNAPKSNREGNTFDPYKELVFGNQKTSQRIRFNSGYKQFRANGGTASTVRLLSSWKGRGE